jgi:hypothetical protein
MSSSRKVLFFTPGVYQVLQAFQFRAGGAREFFRCLRRDDLIHFVDQATAQLAPTPAECRGSVQESLALIQQRGKYWASVGGRYAWFVFPQRFSLCFTLDEWRLYDQLITRLTRPPEWGGGLAASFNELTTLLQSADRLHAFRQAGIIQPLWESTHFTDVGFCLAARGYLIWERKTRDFLLEVRLRRLEPHRFELAVCQAANLPNPIADQMMYFRQSLEPPTFRFTGERDVIVHTLDALHA